MQQKRFHLIIDLSEVQKDLSNNADGLANFLKTMPRVIGMHVLKGPEIAVGLPENPGISGFVIIDFSHISVHTFTKYNEALVDIFSCKPFDKEKAILATLDYFRVSRDNTRIKEVWWG